MTGYLSTRAVQRGLSEISESPHGDDRNNALHVHAGLGHLDRFQGHSYNWKKKKSKLRFPVLNIG